MFRYYSTGCWSAYNSLPRTTSLSCEWSRVTNTTTRAEPSVTFDVPVGPHGAVGSSLFVGGWSPQSPPVHPFDPKLGVGPSSYDKGKGNDLTTVSVDFLFQIYSYSLSLQVQSYLLVNSMVIGLLRVRLKFSVISYL